MARPVLVVLAVVTALLGLGAPASAHTRLVSTTPPDGAVLEQQPSSLELTFSEQLISLGSGAELSGPDGVAQTSFDVTGQSLVVAVARPLPAGEYALAWRVTSADGHPVSGTLGFTVAQSAAPDVNASSDTEPNSPFPESTSPDSTSPDSTNPESAAATSTATPAAS